jgi:hypothetical protein
VRAWFVQSGERLERRGEPHGDVNDLTVWEPRYGAGAGWRRFWFLVGKGW